MEISDQVMTPPRLWYLPLPMYLRVSPDCE